MDDRQLKAQSDAAASYTKHLLTLSKLTGEDVKGLQEKNAAASQSLAFQMKMATMEEDEKRKLLANLATIQANGGTAAVQAFQAEFLNMPPLTQAAQNYVALNTEGYGLIKASIDDVYDTSLSVQANMDKQATLGVGLMQTNHDMAVNLGTQVAAMGAGMDGISGIDFESLLGDQAESIATYTTKAGEFNTAAALANFEAAKGEGDKITDVVNSLNTLKITVSQIQDELETNVKTPLIEAAGSAVTAITDQIAKIPDSELFKTAMTTAKTQIEEFGAAISTLITSLVAPGADPLALTKSAFFDGATAIMNGMKNLLLGKVIEDPGDPNRGEREGGLIRDLFAPAFSAAGTALVDGIKYLWEEHPGTLLAAGAAITALFALPALGTAMVTGIASMWALKSIGTAMSSGIGSMFGRIKPPVGSPTVGRDPKTGRFTSLKNAPKGGMLKNAGKLALRGAKFIPGVGLVAAGAMGLFDGYQGFNADPNAGFLESAGNAGSSIINGLSFGLLGSSPEEIAANAGGSSPASTTMNTPAGTSNIDALNSLDADSVIQYTTAMERLVEVLEKVNNELSKDNNGIFASGTGTNAGDMINSIGGLNNGGSGSSEQLNSTMQSILQKLEEIRVQEELTAKNTKNITGSNLARGNVSNLAN